ncbi:hypothetical protein GCM10023156_05380 [Novipirellula rosea]|uniref:Uncharacterized protein n=1 Tax=Novipirellula rosea TaxID=1031540 RepID=A0ABP8M936_9BACT
MLRDGFRKSLNTGVMPEESWRFGGWPLSGLDGKESKNPRFLTCHLHSLKTIAIPIRWFAAFLFVWMVDR